MSPAVSGFSSIVSSIKIAHTVGYRNFFNSIRSRNTCKTCALGMGGQQGGMVNEAGSFPEICKKSIQSQLTDIQNPIPENLFRDNTIAQFKAMRPRDLERLGRLNTPLWNTGVFSVVLIKSSLDKFNFFVSSLKTFDILSQ